MRNYIIDVRTGLKYALSGETFSQSGARFTDHATDNRGNSILASSAAIENAAYLVNWQTDVLAEPTQGIWKHPEDSLFSVDCQKQIRNLSDQD